MTATMDCSQARLSLGVYVLGAIDPDERALVDGHLADCPDCRDELAGFTGLPALLALVSQEEAIALAASDPPPAPQDETLEPQDRLVGTVLDLAAARRRRRRWRESTVGAAAALVIAAGVFGGLRMTATPAPAPSASGWLPNVGVPSGSWQQATGQSRGMDVTVKYRQMTWGTLLTSQVSGITPGTDCQIWVVVRGGDRILAGGWTVGNDEGTVWYPESAAVPADSVQKFVITVGKTGSVTANS